MSNKAVLILSGGMDSTTLLYKIIKDGFDPHVLSINYGQKHSKEIKFARKTCKKLKINHKVIDLRLVGKQLLQGSALTSKNIDVPEGHFEDNSMKATVVPSRNLLLLSLAISYAVSIKASNVFYGAILGDLVIYPDCRPEFVDAVKNVAKLCDWQPVEIIAPFLTMDKGDVVKLGIELGVNYKWTSTCYNGKELACGVCGSCQERVAAFVKAGIVDPIKYKNGWDKTVEHVLAVAKEKK